MVLPVEVDNVLTEIITPTKSSLRCVFLRVRDGNCVRRKGLIHFRKSFEAVEFRMVD